jgi:peptide/nickel transport system permease protein/oligopeptide transport system permease protein
LKSLRFALRGVSPARLTWRRFRRSRLALAGGVLVSVMVIAGAFAPVLAPYPYARQFRDVGRAKGPSAAHWLGVDALNRDQLSRLLHGARVSLTVALAATTVSLVIGVAVGGLAGYAGGWLDEALMRVADTFSAFPGILLAIGITAAVRDRSIVVVFLALGVVGWPALARIVRGQVLTVKVESYVDAARALGARPGRILVRHILGNSLAPVIVAVTVMMAGNILGEAGLGFLGIGVRPPYPSWGMMLNEARAYLTLHPWMCIAPGLAISLAVLGFNLLGDGLRDALDPKTAPR